MEYSVDEFISYHNSKYINYCEAIILPDGHITYSEPSHVHKLQMIWGVPLTELYCGGETRDKLWKSMPQSASPVHWLSEELNCVVLWYDAIIFPPNYTEAQMYSVKQLMKNKCIDEYPLIQITIEKDVCDPANRSTDRIQALIDMENKVKNKIRSELFSESFINLEKSLDIS